MPGGTPLYARQPRNARDIIEFVHNGGVDDKGRAAVLFGECLGNGRAQIGWVLTVGAGREVAEMLDGSTEEIVAKLIELLKAKGGLK